MTERTTFDPNKPARLIMSKKPVSLVGKYGKNYVFAVPKIPGQNMFFIEYFPDGIPVEMTNRLSLDLENTPERPMHITDERVQELVDGLRFSASTRTEDASQTYLEAADALLELIELRAKVAAYKQLDAAQCAQLTHYAKEDRRDHAARATLESERTANAELTEMCMRLEQRLAAGPVMPEVPSEAVLVAMGDAATHPMPRSMLESIWRHARQALWREQGK